ncbi:AMP-binding enzyme domain-containing protein [Hirsutella rhossiliensis]|uniref:AMP-binding enzyme domain-containing protein n=1 Tax=Hirsutella rhossiliensis TaxID=111463 RepID=A0A9P8MYT4_9HYPO|nr:AMP-binding enzyme domain-containing protein [Hirsutella rhossiliensis]KAH0963790.1 AMP-binding enzyme domain-containing protein [Hirsutella rhossiliensis]
MQTGVELALATAWAVVLKTYTVSVQDEASLNSISQMLQRDLFRSDSFRVSRISAVPTFRKSDDRPFCNTALSIASCLTPPDRGIDVQIAFEVTPKQLCARLMYSGEILDEAQAVDIALAFQHTLSVLISSPATSCSDLNLVHPQSLVRLFSWNASVPESVDRCVGELFQEQASSRPNDMAVHASDAAFTYAELAVMTEVLASDLQSRGIGPETVVLLCFPKSVWAVVAMMAVVRAGAAVLFLDSSHPTARLQEIQSQVKAPMLLTAPQYADMWHWTAAEVLVVNQALLDSLPRPREPVSSAVTPSSMLYIIFTSGSTGKPKGCCVEHRQFLTGCYAQRKASGMLPTDRVLQLASFTFDVSMLEIVTSLITGACVCIPGDAARVKGPAYCIQEFDVTWAFLTPSLVRLMTPAEVPSLRFLVLGGEPLAKANIETWAPHLQLANGYGPTECSIAATANPKLNTTTDPANIGYPLSALCWLVDPQDHRRLVPPGAPGELLVHGPIVARGYFQDAAKTTAAFVDDVPWLPKNRFGKSRRMYKTGDLARYNSDGTIHFIGRKDSQVKLRGLRIELGDVEHQIASHELVQQAAAFLPRQGPCKNQLTAVIALKESYRETTDRGLELLDVTTKSLCSVSLDRVTRDASQHLPAYMLPSVFILVRSIPLTASGKLNRVAVAKWIAEMDETMYNPITGAESAVMASTRTEHQIQQLCSEVLDVPLSRVHLNRSFVNNGGDSILGMRLLAKLRAADIDVSVKDMLEAKSLSELADRAKNCVVRQTMTYPISYDMERFKSEVLPQLSLEQDEIEDVYPLGPMQRGILLSQQRASASYELRVVCAVSVPGGGAVDVERLKHAWIAVSNRHACLRTIFSPTILEDAPCDQVVLKRVEPYVATVSCRDEADVSKDVRSRRIVATGTQPRVNFIIYETPGAVRCMAAVDHALIDGVSVQLLFRDLGTAYAGLLDQVQQMKFSHYIGYVQQLQKARSLEYWQTYLRDLAPCQLAGLEGGTADANRLNELSAILEPGMELQKFCRHHSITPASLLQCAWAMTLRAYTGLEDVCFGYLSSGRDAPVADIEDAVGAYINMLVCRLKLDGSKTLIQLVNSVQDSFLNSLPHQHCSLAEIQHKLGLREPLFNTIMSLQSALGDVIHGDPSCDSISFSVVDEVDPTEYDVSINAAIARGVVHLSLRHYTSRISPTMANHILETFKSAIGTIIQGCEKPFADAPLLSHHDMNQILSWNGADWKAFYTCIHDEFEKQVAARGDAVAIDAWDGSLTYGQLDAASTLLASHLSVRGVGPEVLVPLSFEKSVWVPVAQLAVLKAGGACVAIDAAHPWKRREELLGRCDARIAVTSRLHEGLFEGLVGERVVVDQASLDQLATDQSLPLSWTPAKPDNPAFVVFTSGSTGIPKGIVLEHRALVSSAHAHGPSMKYGPGQRILQFASYTFDVSIGETMSGLMLGATVCIPNEEERMDDLPGVINRMAINVVYLTPSVVSLLQPSDTPGLEVLALGGEAVKAENIAMWAGKVHLVNIYGPAECSVWSTGLSPVPAGTSAANIGYGLGARAWIAEVGSPDRLCPIGCVGELLLEGPIVARGYLKDKDKTEAAFIADPPWMASASTGRKLYRTGDLARYNLDGSLHFIGRRDFQIKVHGQRVELGDIEHHIQSHGRVANAVVLYPHSGPVSQRLVAIVSLREPTAADVNNEVELVDPARIPADILRAKAHLSERVPGYMMPSTWLVVQVIPLSVNGKTDRSRLLRFVQGLETVPEQTGAWDAASPVVLPSTPAEETLRAVISTVLGIAQDSVSMDQSFVGLGGDSITAMQVSVRCRTNALTTSVRDVLLSKSIRQLASADLSLLDQEAKIMGLSGLEDVEDGYPVSPMQQGLLIAQAQTSGNYKPYVICQVTAAKHAVEVTADRLQAAWQRVMVLKKAPARVARVDDLAALNNIIWTDPIDYEDRRPPHRLTTCATNDKLFFNLEISHTLIDGASMAIILKDLAAAYLQDNLAPGPLYRDYISLLQTQSRQESLDYWKGYLDGAQSCTFPKLHDRDVPVRTLETVEVPLPPETIGKLHTFSRSTGVTLANVLQTAWGLVLRSFSGSTDVLLGFMASGRDISLTGIEEAVGPYINMLVCRVDASNNICVLDAIRKTQRDYLDALPHQHQPLAEIQHSLNLTSGRLFNTILSLQRPLSEDTGPESDIGINYLQGRDPTEYDLSVSITASDSAIEASICFWSSFLSAEQGSQVASTLSQILNQMLDKPAATLAELDFLCDSDRRKIFAWNKNGITPQKVHQLIHHNFARHALDRPGATAVASWDGVLTYGELDEASRCLAHHLRHLGVTSEVIVPLCFDKSKWTVVAMLAILRAGGAYTSMDPSSPAKHLANIIEQTQAKLVLTSAAQYANKLSKAVQLVVVVDQALLDKLPVREQPPAEICTPDNAAFISFTSGSTGRPKAICLTHSSFTSVMSHNPEMGMGPQSRVCQFAAYVFDTSNSEIFGPLTCGGSVCIPSEHERLNDLAGAMKRLEVNWTFLTPSVASSMTPADVPKLTTLALCGERVPDDIVKTWKDDVQLINSYGPAECTIWTSMAILGRGRSPATISRGYGGDGCLLWVADTADVGKLAPVGAIGELLIEGPILARGYLDAEKTAQAFIAPPRWRGSTATTCRMYRSGDLVRYHDDGTLIYVGRADGQVKLNGQRIETSEIERHIVSHHLVRYAVVLMPKSGPCRRQLVAVVAPSEFSEKTMALQEPCTITDKPSKIKAAAQVAQVREQLRSLVPGYMVPSVWLLLEAFPLTASRKMDRVRVSRWVQDLSNDDYSDALDIGEEQPAEATVVPDEKRLQQIISAVLNVPLDQVRRNKSFLNLGGDSILAMHLVVQCRKQGIKLAVKDIMRSKTISSLALTVKTVASREPRQEELLDAPFPLSPIQSMYFSELTKGSLDAQVNQFNQSFLLGVKTRQSPAAIARAVQQVVEHHPMLRARFLQSRDGVWSQMVLSQIAGSYRIGTHDVKSREDALFIAKKAQEQMDIRNGPVFGVELFNVSDASHQLLFVVAHHLVVDLVSWRTIIRQMEDILTLGNQLPGTKPFPFHSWVKAQADYGSRHLRPQTSLPHQVPDADYGYWGMENKPNLRGDTAELSFAINQKDTDLLLRGCHRSMKTEALDVFLAAAFFSFAATFSRPPPAIFNEGHGREPWDSQMDITETVGWFTTMFPLQVSPRAGMSMLDTVRRLKDQRRCLPRSGWAYFNSALSNDEGKTAFKGHWPVEILFNYHGVYQGQAQSDSLFHPQPFNEGDVGPQVSRFALMEINAYVLEGAAHFTLTYNRNMKHAVLMERWATSYARTLVDMGHELKIADPMLTPGDFPLLSTTNEILERFQNDVLVAVAAVDDVEDMLPCSPMQEGILLSQNRIQGAYNVEMVVEVSSTHGQAIDVPKLAKAWQTVVDRHATLRTVFVQNLSDRPYDQLVLKKHTAEMVVRENQPEQAVSHLQKAKALDYALAQPPHCMTLLHTLSGRVVCKLEISHALVDGTSTSILVSEWIDAYRDKSAALPSPVYSDYIAYIHSRPRDDAIDHWKSYLANVRPCHLPTLTDGELAPERLFHEVEIEVPSAARMRSFCQENNVTLASIFRLAWAKVLGAFVGDDHVCFGYLASGREVPVPGIEGAIGAFINMLVCSVDLGHISRHKVDDSLVMFQEQYLKSLPYQHVGLAQIQHELGLAGQTLFNTVLSFQRRSHGDLSIGDLRLRHLDGVDPTEYSASVSISDSQDGIHVHMSYVTDQLCDRQASNVASALSNVLASIVETPHAQVGHLNLYGTRDAKQIALWNAEPWAPINKCVHEIFADNANKCPDAVAIDSSEGSMTYGELDTEATQLAHELVALGIQVDSLVPISFEKSAWAIVAMLGIMKAGAGFVPLDPAHPDDRLRAIISQTASCLVLASETTAQRIQTLVDNVLTLSSRPSERSSSSITPAKPPVSPANVAYVLFTSGSTGLPKGVVLTHLAVSSSTLHHGAEIGCSPATRMYQFATYTFDACIFEIFTTLAHGGCVCVPSDEERMSDIAGFMVRKRVNTAFMTPSLVRILAPDQVPTLKTLVLGGEALGQDNIATWTGKVRLMNGYGPTETCVFALMKTFEDPRDGHDVLGRGVGSQPWIVSLQDATQLAPIGAVGMLHLSGPSLARGYLHDKARTNSVFIDNPAFLKGFQDWPQRVYNTGDLARYNSDGTITYLGRKDQQVKLRGQRIELSEIEYHVKSSFPQASQVSVEVVFPLAEKERATVATFFRHANQPEQSQMLLPLTDALRGDVARLQGILGTLLPPYEVPSLYIPVGKMPTTAAGKLDRKALRDAVASMSEEDLGTFSPVQESRKPLVTATETRLALLWSEVLKLPVSRIGRHDNFFRMGGDSIAAMKLAAKLTSGISLTVSDIFRHATLSDMAVVAAKDASTANTMVDVKPFELLKSTLSVKDARPSFAAKCNVSENQVADAYPCTPLQESLMALSMLYPGAYTAHKAFKLPNSIDMARFKAAWEKTIDNNPVLRTTIIQTKAGRAVQVVLKDCFKWREAATLRQYMEDDEKDEMAFGKPLSRYAMTDDGYFIWTAHHSMYDGWTVPLILEQVTSYYASGTAPATPGFNRFVQHVSTLSTDEARGFWESQLSAGKAVTFPEPPSSSHPPRVDQEVHHSVPISRQPGSEVPMATVLRSAWAYVLAQHSDADDVLFGMTLSGRNCPVQGIDTIVGPTITTVPVRVSVPAKGTVVDFLKAVQQQATEMMRFEHFGLQNIANINQDTSQAVKFQNILVVQPMKQFHVDHTELLGAEQVSKPLNSFDTYPLIMECSLGETEVRLNARFDEAVISRSQTERILRHFEHVLHGFNEATGATKMRDISMLTKDDFSQILAWNSTYPEALETTVPEVFAQQVLRRPDALAVDAWDGKLTYAELDQLSTNCARHLVEQQGVGPEILVPVCFEKSRWAIVTQLSIMKAGGAVVNLDPSYPMSRQELILQDTGAKVLLVASQLYSKFSDVKGVRLVAIDKMFYRRLTKPSWTALPVVDPSSTAYVLFTSGSTGRPKGIVVEHRNLCSSSQAHGTAWDIGPSTRLLQFAAYTFDVSCADIFTTLQRGGCICVPSEHDRLNDLAGSINRFRCNWAFLTPTVASLLPAHGIPSLRKLVLGGEASTKDTIAKWHRSLDLIVCYGPAECSVYCSGAPPATATSDPADLGEAIGALYWVADAHDHNRLVPIGCTGELLLEGPTVARGYLHDKHKTAQTFIYNPAWADGSTPGRPRRFYRTGDLVRYNEDGTIHFVGRKDTQVKVRGQRVELGEIEHAIRIQMPSLTHVTVDAVSLDSRQAVVAFLHVTAKSSGSDEVLPLDDQLKEDLMKLQASIAEVLPFHMQPNMFVPMAQVPLTANGKVDRRRLRDLVTNLGHKRMLQFTLESSTKRVPATDMEFALRDLWAQALSVDPPTIGTQDQFFRVGGDSILAMKLVAAAGEHQIPLHVRDFFYSPVLSDMAKALESRLPVRPNDTQRYQPLSLITSTHPIKLVRAVASQIKTSEANIADVLPATDFQLNAVAHALMKTRGLRNYLWLDGTGHLDMAATHEALRAFVAEHEILRTVFALHRADIVQVVLKQLRYEVEEHLTSTDIANFTDQICRSDMSLPTKLTDPLLKFIIIQASGNRHRIVLRISHAQYDGISLPKLWDSLAAALEGRPNPTPVKPMSTFMRAISSQDQDEALQYWGSLLKGSSMTRLVAHTKPSHQNVYNTYLRRTIPTASLANCGTTFATILKAAWSLVLASLTSTCDVTFGHVVSGRTLDLDLGISAVVGACINIVPVRVAITDPELSVSQLLQAVQAQHAAGLLYEAVVGTRTIVRQCAPWAPHTRFSSIVQHQNIEEASHVAVRGVDYEVGFFCPQADEADVAIKTTPQGDGTTEVLLICSDRAVGEELGGFQGRGTIEDDG